MQTLYVDTRAMREYQQKTLGKLSIIYVWDTPKASWSSRDSECFLDEERTSPCQNSNRPPYWHHVLHVLLMDFKVSQSQVMDPLAVARKWTIRSRSFQRQRISQNGGPQQKMGQANSSLVLRVSGRRGLLFVTVLWSLVQPNERKRYFIKYGRFN